MTAGAPSPRPVRREHRDRVPHLAPQVTSPPAAPTRIPAALTGRLTRWQLSIVRLVAEGLRDQDIARELGTTPRTIDVELRRIRARLDAVNRAHLAAIAIRRGLIP